MVDTDLCLNINLKQVKAGQLRGPIKGTTSKFGRKHGGGNEQALHTSDEGSWKPLSSYLQNISADAVPLVRPASNFLTHETYTQLRHIANMSYKDSAVHKTVQASLDSVTSNSETGIPGLVFVAVNRDGEVITANASGNRSLETKQPMTLDTTFWIASCTKMVTAMAVMQLVEQGKLSLDDHRQLYDLCPELERVKVLNDAGQLVDREAEITMRMLLSHVSLSHAILSFDEVADLSDRPLDSDTSSSIPS